MVKTLLTYNKKISYFLDLWKNNKPKKFNKTLTENLSEVTKDIVNTSYHLKGDLRVKLMHTQKRAKIQSFNNCEKESSSITFHTYTINHFLELAYV